RYDLRIQVINTIRSCLTHAAIDRNNKATRYQLLIRATAPDMDFTQEEFDLVRRNAERESQLMWALDYLQAVKETWNLKNRSDFLELVKNYAGYQMQNNNNNGRVWKESIREEIRY
ncbi:unnamed protein product, partial [Trichobilharzia regenti]